MKNKDDLDSIYSELEQSLGIKRENANLFFIGKRVHKKFSESDKIEKEYKHYFYKVELTKPINKFKEKEFENSNKKYMWLSFDELTKDKRIKKVNSDIVNFVKELDI